MREIMLCTTYHSKKDAGTENSNSIMLLDTAFGRAQSLWYENFERGEEACNALRTRLLLVAHGFR